MIGWEITLYITLLYIEIQIQAYLQNEGSVTVIY